MSISFLPLVRRYSFDVEMQTAVGFGLDLEAQATAQMGVIYDLNVTGLVKEYPMDTDLSVLSMYSRDYREKLQMQNTITLEPTLGLKPQLKVGAYVGLNDKYHNRLWLKASTNVYLYARITYGFTGLLPKEPK